MLGLTVVNYRWINIGVFIICGMPFDGQCLIAELLYSVQRHWNLTGAFITRQ